MSHTRRMTLAVVALLVVLIAIPVQASAGSLVPFQVSWSATNTTVPCPAGTPVPSLCVAIVGSGTATHMGEIESAGLAIVNLASNCGAGCFTDFGRQTLTAANGDKIMLESSGKNSATADPTIRFRTGHFVVTGGTGRFSGATGSGTATATINLATSTSTATFVGVLSTPGSSE